MGANRVSRGDWGGLLDIGLGALGAGSGIGGLRALNKWCFVAGTQVIVGINADGTYITVNIEDLKPGDEVLAKDQHDATDGVQRRRVTRVFRSFSGRVRVIVIRDAGGNVEVIVTTDEHPFWVQGIGWVRAADLAAGMRLGEADGSDDAVVVSNERREAPEGVAVYNIEVEGDHTYFVEDGYGEQTAVWVHNTCVYREIVNGKPRYFGITDQAFEARAAQQLRTHGRAIEAIEGLEDLAARKLGRAVEHLLIQKYGRVGKDPGGILSNINRGIDPKKIKNYKTEMPQAQRLIDDLGL